MKISISALVSAVPLVAACALAPMPVGEPFEGSCSYGNTNLPALQYYDDGNGVYSLGYGGHDMWGSDEGYSYVYLLSGSANFSLSADVELYGSNRNMLGGIMVRNAIEPGGYCLCFNYRINSDWVKFWNVNGRIDANGIGNIILGDGNLRGDDEFCQMKLERDGNEFLFFCRESADAEWTQFGSFVDENSLFGDSVYVGFYMCSGGSNGWVNFRNAEYVCETGGFSAPSFVSATKGTDEAVITWGRAEGATGYRIERKLPDDADWTLLAVEPAAETGFSYEDRTVARDGTAYLYRVVATGAEEGQQAASSVVRTLYFDYADGTGLRAIYYDTSNYGCRAVTNRVESYLNFPWNEGGPVEGLTENFMAVYSGKLTVPYDGTFSFYWEVDDSMLVKIDGATVAPNAGINLTKGDHDIWVAYKEGTGYAYFHLSWRSEGDYFPSGFIPMSQLKPAESADDLSAAGWDGFCALGYGAAGWVDYDAATGTHEILYQTQDMWDTTEGYVYLWRRPQKDDFDFSFRLDNLADYANHKCGAMLRRSPALGECCLTFNHRLSDDYTFYFLDVNGRQSEGAGITDHKTGWNEPVTIGRSLYMKISRRGSVYSFHYRHAADEEWTLFDTFDDTGLVLGERPVVGLVCYECNGGVLQKGLYDAIEYREAGGGTIVVVK